jgi:Na+-translocating ferredoxin:NAD+ oxidoreductase RnfG subunit
MRNIPGFIALPLAFIAPVAVMQSAHAEDYLSIAQAQKILFPDASIFLESAIQLSDEQRANIKKIAGVRQRNEVQQNWRAEQDGKLLGYFLVDEVIGKHEFITYATAISPEGKVIGIEILSYRETHGGQIRKPEWRQYFAGKTLGDQFKLNKDIPNISGATLSCRNVTDGVKRLLAIHKIALTVP